MALMVAVVDYGMGNLGSMAKALEYLGADVAVTSSVRDIRAAERIILPGVGAFGTAVANLRETGLIHTLQDEVLHRGKPFLGVCLGMQLLARRSVEHGVHEGLGWLDAVVLPLTAASANVKLPHTGWNEIEPVCSGASPVTSIRDHESFYFNHSYHLIPRDPKVVAARCKHGEDFVAAVSLDNVLATQFHPEKSQRAGLDFLGQFLAWQPEKGRSESPF
jgi:imidazole glycerol-phosphate synthase subunit HisH